MISTTSLGTLLKGLRHRAVAETIVVCATHALHDALCLYQSHSSLSHCHVVLEYG